MTSGVDHPQIEIKINGPDKFEETGIIGWVELFGNSNYSIVVRPGVVIVDGAAMLSPDKVMIFIEALDAAARMARDHERISRTSKGKNYPDIT